MNLHYVGPVKVMTDGEMTGTATITSTPLSVKQHSAVGAQTTHTGAAVGTITLEGSLDYNPTTGTGNWGTIATTEAWTAVNNNAGTQVRSATNVAAAYVRIKYVNSSSTGTLQAWLCAK